MKHQIFKVVGASFVNVGLYIHQSLQDGNDKARHEHFRRIGILAVEKASQDERLLSRV